MRQQIQLNMLGRILPVMMLLCLSLHLPLLSAQSSGDLPDLMSLSEEALAAGDEDQALDLYIKALNLDHENYDALWNSSLLYIRRGHRYKKESQASGEYGENIYYQVAMELGERCLEEFPERSRCHYVYGLSLAALADGMQTSRERIQMIHKAGDHARRAAELDPDYGPVWHLKGIWHSKISSVSRTERMAARLIYGGLPEGASREQAERFLKRAIEMEPDEILFRLDLGQHYQETGQHSLAIETLEGAFTLQPRSASDRIYLEEAGQRLLKLRN